jgi:hypothetical protein
MPTCFSSNKIKKDYGFNWIKNGYDIKEKYLKIHLIKTTYKTLLGRPEILTATPLTSRLQNQQNFLTHR